jgi:hypothetical protein
VKEHIDFAVTRAVGYLQALRLVYVELGKPLAERTRPVDLVAIGYLADAVIEKVEQLPLLVQTTPFGTQSVWPEAYQSTLRLAARCKPLNGDDALQGRV